MALSHGLSEETGVLSRTLQIKGPSDFSVSPFVIRFVSRHLWTNVFLEVFLNIRRDRVPLIFRERVYNA